MKRRWFAAFLTVLLLLQACAASCLADDNGAEEEGTGQSIEDKVNSLLNKGAEEQEPDEENAAPSPASDNGEEPGPVTVEDKVNSLLAARGGSGEASAKVAEELFDPMWYTKCTYYWDTDSKMIQAIDGYEGVITAWAIYGNAALGQFRDNMYKPDGSGAYVYEDIVSDWKIDDGDYTLYYYPEDGSVAISCNGERTIYAPLQRHGEEYDVPEDFDEQWYERSGLMYVSMLDNVTFTRYGSDMFAAVMGMTGVEAAFRQDGYEGAACNGVFYQNDDGMELYYYPELSFILMGNSEGIFNYGLVENSDNQGQADGEYEYDPLIYFIENSDLMYFGWEDIEGFDSDMCTLAINGVYARSGRAFQSSELSEYYSQFDWYSPSIAPENFTDYMLNDYQISNIQLLLEYKEYMGF